MFFLDYIFWCSQMWNPVGRWRRSCGQLGSRSGSRQRKMRCSWGTSWHRPRTLCPRSPASWQRSLLSHRRPCHLLNETISVFSLLLSLPLLCVALSGDAKLQRLYLVELCVEHSHARGSAAALIRSDIHEGICCAILLQSAQRVVLSIGCHICNWLASMFPSIAALHQHECIHLEACTCAKTCNYTNTA